MSSPVVFVLLHRSFAAWPPGEAFPGLESITQLLTRATRLFSDATVPYHIRGQEEFVGAATPQRSCFRRLNTWIGWQDLNLRNTPRVRQLFQAELQPKLTYASTIVLASCSVVEADGIEPTTSTLQG